MLNFVDPELTTGTTVHCDGHCVCTRFALWPYTQARSL